MTLNQSQQREIAKTLVFMQQLGKDYGARALSALYRSARKTSQQNEILAIAIANGLVSNSEWIHG
jgi:outer membrane usher protein FimD/PapC